MRLHALTLSNVKGICDRRLLFPDTGIVVIEGANEVGKTSMIEALDMLLDEKDSSRKRQVLAMRPVGRDVPSMIEAEMSSGPYRFIYRKQWFRQAATELTVVGPRREHLTGVQAHERVQAMLAETADLHLWKSLRLMQATPFGQAELSGSSALAAALDSAAGRVDTAGSEGDSLVAAAETAYFTYFTRGRGEPTGQFRAVSEAVALAVGDAGRARSALDEVRSDVERHARVVDELTHCETDLIAGEAEFEALTHQWTQARALVESAERARSALTLASREHQLAVDAERERTRLGAQLSAVRAGVERATAAAAALVGDLGPEQSRVSALTVRHDLAREACEALRLAKESAAADVVHVRDLADMEALGARCRALEAALAAREAAATALASRTVDRATLARVESTSAALEVARAALEAGSASVEIIGLAAAGVLTADGEPLALGAGERWCRSVSDPIELVVPGVARIRLSPQSGLADRVALVGAAREAFAEALARAGAEDLVEARALHEHWMAATAALKEASTRFETLLSGDRVDVLRERLASLRVSAATFTAQRPGGSTLPASVGEAQDVAHQTRVRFDAAAVEVGGLAAELQRHRDAVAAIRLELATVESLRESLATQAAVDEARLDELRTQASDDDVLAAVASTAVTRDAAGDVVRVLQEQVEACDPEGVRLRLAACETSLPSVRTRRTALRDERVGIEARLEQAAGQGRREQLDQAQVKVQRAEREQQSVARRALAARVLHDTLQRHRAEAKRAYVEPFADAVRRFGQAVYHPDFDVEVADDLTIGARVLDGRRIDVDALSTGAREQLAIISRLAAASLVDAEHGVPVVIDDALGYSDPERLARVCAAFSLVGPDAQLVLLSCTPGRYAGVGDATVISL